MTATDEPPVTLIAAPPRGVWRLGRAVDPLQRNRLEPETSLGSSAGRFSLPSYGMLYCCSEPTGCYAEGLAAFRVDPGIRELLDTDGTAKPALMKPGHLASSWREDRILVRLLPHKEARFLDVDCEATRALLAKELHSELAAWGISGPLTNDHIHGADRRVARQIAAWTVAQRNAAGHMLAQGIAYHSGYGGRRCWAILGDADLEEAERRPILAESVELQEVAKEYGLTVW
ncbi:RES domain-containing protein [Streptomyces sp. NPDC048196]|uniref:RES domain-containing protein n=1 Tax=Streptomyces sp. NPDC048196 TaxID=3154712 RepID=UPI0033E14DBF